MSNTNESKKENVGILKEESKSVSDMTPIELDGKYETVFYIIRHGQSIGNAKREFLGHTDKDLSELGYLQAERTGEFLSYAHVDVIYSSDLIRAYNTAVPHAKRRNLEIIKDKNLREMHAGVWEGMMVENILAGYYDEFTVGWRANFGTFTIPGGESVQHAAHRMNDEILKIAKENEGKKILIASHAAAIRAFYGLISNVAPEDLAAFCEYPKNASVTVVYFDGEKLIPGEYSHSKHLVYMET